MYFQFKDSTMPLLVLSLLFVVLAIWSVSLFNTLVQLRNKRQNAFADIDVQLRQRHDLVPQLVSTVKGYATHEKDLLEKITEARSAAMNASSIPEKIATEQKLGSALAGLKIALEAYPDLKANQSFIKLQDSLNEIEEKLAVSRRFFNRCTTDYNNSVESFPSNLIANNFNFQREILFDLGSERREKLEVVPDIKF